MLCNKVIVLVQGHIYRIQGKPKHLRSCQRKELLKESVELQQSQRIALSELWNWLPHLSEK